MLNLGGVNLFLFRSLTNLSELTVDENMHRASDIFMYNDPAHVRQTQQDIANIIGQYKQEKKEKKERKLRVDSMTSPVQSQLLLAKSQHHLQLNAQQRSEIEFGKFKGKFRYFDNPDGFETDDKCRLVANRSLSEKRNPIGHSKSISSIRSMSKSTPSTPLNETENTRPNSVSQPEVVKLSENIINLIESCHQHGEVTVDSQSLQSILHDFCSLQEHNAQLSQRLKQEKVHNERSQLVQLEQSQSMQERCAQLEHELATQSRYKVICSICLDQVEEIYRSKRILLSTFCGHIFCDHCLQRSMLCSSSKQSSSNSDSNNSKTTKRFTCPRCRKSLTSQVTASEPSKFAHALFI